MPYRDLGKPVVHEVRRGLRQRFDIPMEARIRPSHGNGADGTLANGLAPVAGVDTQFATVTYTAGRKKHHANPRPAL